MFIHTTNFDSPGDASLADLSSLCVKRWRMTQFFNPLSAKGEERVIQRSADRVSTLLFSFLLALFFADLVKDPVHPLYIFAGIIHKKFQLGDNPHLIFNAGA